MLLKSLRALCLAPGGPGTIWNYLGAPVRPTAVSGRFACGFPTDLHFADEGEGHQGEGHHISKMYFSYWEPPGVSERRRSVKLEASISGENQTLGGHSGRPSE
jgi:hypothetical protein